MNNKEFWFYIEPYVYVNVLDNSALLYNTLDGESIEIFDDKVIEILSAVLDEKNLGVIRLSDLDLLDNSIKTFLDEVRSKYMGDLIDVKLSNVRPVQLLPYCNYKLEKDTYIKQNFSPYTNIINHLIDLNFYLSCDSIFDKIVEIVDSIPQNININFIINFGFDFENIIFLEYIKLNSNRIKIICDYRIAYEIFKFYFLENKFEIKINCESLDVDKILFIFEKDNDDFEYILYVESYDEYEFVNSFASKFETKKMFIKPKYNKMNIEFFRDNVFLSKEDILSSGLKIKDILMNKMINIFDYGKINIFSNGDAYANIHHSKLGNVFEQSIYEIVQREVDKGTSWFCVRDKFPCNKCLYQWLCPSPSNYELEIGITNLCNVK